MSRKKAQASANLPDDMQQCLTILKFLQGKQDAQPFLEPVDWKAYNLPDYPEIIKHPMDLGTIDKKLLQNKYTSPEKFAADVRLVWKNAQTYNRSDSGIYAAAEALSKLFEKKFAKIKKSGATPGSPSENVDEPGSPSASGSAGAPSSNKRRRTESKGETREVTRADRVKFSQLVNQLSSDQLGHVVGILQRQSPQALNEEDDEELEIEINNIDSATLLALNAYANECISANANKKKKR